MLTQPHPVAKPPTHGIGTALYVTLVRGGQALPPRRLRHVRIVVRHALPPIVG